MKKTSVLAGAALLLAGPAVAADLAKPVYKAPPMIAPGFTWTGCYVGGTVGGARAHESAATTTTGLPNVAVVPVPGAAAGVTQVVGAGQADTAGDFSQGTSVIGGPHVGCNYQFMSGLLPGLVAGAEADFNWTGISGSFDAPNVVVAPANAVSVPAGGGISATSDTRWAATLRARLGYAIVPNVLVYGTGGGAWGATDYTASNTFNTGASLATSFSASQSGWVAGGGVEWAPWSNNWILRLEYLHYDFGGVSTTVTGTNAVTKAPIATTFTFGDLKLDTVRAGVSYKF